MITRLDLKNFKGVADDGIRIAPVTILTGANNSGKSSLMYGLLTLKNITINPNQPIDSFFNFIFMNLGGLKESIYLKDDESERMQLQIQCAAGDLRSTYAATLGKNQSRLALSVEKPLSLKMAIDVTFPYGLTINTGISLRVNDYVIKATWNGSAVTVTASPYVAPPAPAGTGSPTPAAVPASVASPASTGAPPPTTVTETVEPASGAQAAPGSPPSAASQAEATRVGRALGEAMALPATDLKGVDFVPLKRGFTKPLFSPVPLQPQLLTEDEIATYVANDRDLEAAISFHLEKIVDKTFQVRPVLGTASFYLQTQDRKTGFLCDLVNDGFGTNELVYLLAKVLRKQQSLVCIEEPEIHIHPGALTRLMRVLIDIALENNRHFVISTHSEHLVVELLNCVARKTISTEDVRIYFLSKEKSRTKIEEQKVTEKGQIEGGLKGFYEAELEQIRDFIGATGNK